MVDVVLVVVSWNSGRHLPALLESLDAAMIDVGSWQLVVADNDSADASAALVERLAPRAAVVRTGGNRGYAGGINVALAAAPPSRAVLVLNPDVRLLPHSVRLLLDGLGHGVGIAVPRLTERDGTLAHSLRREPTVLRALGEALLGGVWAGRFAPLGEVERRTAAYDRPTRSDWATGAALMVSQECLRAVGPWDESFFLYSEETDYLLRARDAGFSTRLVPAAGAVHEGGESHLSPDLWSRLVVNRAVLYGRRHGRLAAAAFRGALVLGEGLRALRGNPTHRAALRALVQVQPARPREHPRPTVWPTTTPPPP